MASIQARKELETDLLGLKKQLDAIKNSEYVAYDMKDVIPETNLPYLITQTVQKNVGTIDQYGDMFVGIKNTSTFSLDITLSMGKFIKEKITIKPGEIAQAFNNYPIPQFYNERKIHYEIKKTSPDDFFYSVFCNTVSISAQFIYGNLTENTRTVLRNGCVFVNYKKSDNKEGILLFFENRIEDWLNILCSIFPDYVNDTFSQRYLQNEYDEKDIIPNFKKMNPHWIEITTRLD